MKGGVRKRGSSWYYYFDVGKVDGKRKKIERKGGTTEKEALKKLNEEIFKYNTGYVEPNKITANQYLNDWIENYIKEEKKINTYYRYKEIFNNNLKSNLNNLSLQDIKPIHITNLLSKERKKKLSNTTLQIIYGVLNSALNRAVKLQMINDNPCKFVDRPKRKKFKPSVLTLEEINGIFQSLDTENYNDYIISLALNIVLELGLRRGELGGLEWNDIDFENHCINIKNNLIYTNCEVKLTTTKTEDSERTLYISDKIIKLLKAHKKIQAENKLKYGPHYEDNVFNSKKYNFVMTWENGKYVHPNYYTSKFKKITNKLNLNKNVRFHDLRHTNATLLLKQGVDFKIIQSRLGHSDISTTLNIYSHVSIDMQKSATEKLSKLFNEV
ncbi:tyrosine-type recombinase/integrase [Clostridium sporogenes]|uniref:tyrosine-type recombinase/integrase n=1 Tax=Clostridium sporogenes TaxID=1509 RepID=UPI00072BB683|nr:site-specific integrase [Clostridium sporogenes]KRU36853.1 phage integrase [Clostridium sporogenes]MBY7064013.1 tyrosine-type recombinase/integrase [Clostridium sporogenes]MBY7069568.1 tyrosine-type recombinase/integrase [Clostridium sporogenes]MCW6063627.1 site-specific integrase [Clostridium sporogenes]OQP92726.1 phage integrase [Clostridium sporogenes]